MKNGAGMERDKDQLSINTFTSSAVTSDYMHPVQPYTLQHPRQKAINASLIKNLIIGCCLPISLVENQHFREFMKVVDSRYVIILYTLFYYT